MVRDHTFDYDSSGIEYLKAHEIPQLFQDLTGLQKFTIQSFLSIYPFCPFPLTLHK